MTTKATKKDPARRAGYRLGRSVVGIIAAGAAVRAPKDRRAFLDGCTAGFAAAYETEIDRKPRSNGGAA